MTDIFDTVVVGADRQVRRRRRTWRARARVLLLDRAGRIKPCGGAIPPRAIADFDIPDHLLVGRATAARMIAPSDARVDMPVGAGGDGGSWGWSIAMSSTNGFARAALAGAERRTGSFQRIDRDADGCAVVVYTEARGGAEHRVRARAVIGADGARSGVARATIKGGDRVKCVTAYHEVIRSPVESDDRFDRSRCDVYYQGALSPDFYAWIFPHGETASVGVGSAVKGFAPRESVAALRSSSGLAECETIRCEGAPIPLKPLRRWDNGRDVLVAGDAAGVVAPASGEGIYYAMACGRIVAETVASFLATGDARVLRRARRQFMRAHGRVFLILGIMQHFWYSSDKRRERFVAMCVNPDVQALTWQAYMHKKLVRGRPLAHARIFFQDLRHLLGSAT